MRYVVSPCPRPVADAAQERVAILKILKKDFQVNEALLRVGISCVMSVRLPRVPVGEQGRARRGQAPCPRRQGRRRPRQGDRQKVEKRRRQGKGQGETTRCVPPVSCTSSDRLQSASRPPRSPPSPPPHPTAGSTSATASPTASASPSPATTPATAVPSSSTTASPATRALVSPCPPRPLLSLASSQRSHHRPCDRGRKGRLCPLGRHDPRIQGQDPLPLRQPQGQGEPQPAREHRQRRALPREIQQNDERGTLSSARVSRAHRD
jgi:hypothetical protein